MTCKHRRCWILGTPVGGSMLWCYECGAIRMNKPGRLWFKAVGKGGKNPAMTKRFQKDLEIAERGSCE